MIAVRSKRLISPEIPLQKNGAGVVFTKPWVVKIILDLAGYTSERPLAKFVAIEPSAGDGAFLVEMVRRLAQSCRLQKIPILKATDAIRAYEIDPEAALIAVQTIKVELLNQGLKSREAERLARGWVCNDDFLQPKNHLPSADYVIGNPPYIRLEEIPNDKATFYRNRYATMRGRSDIYIPFFQAALENLKPGGVCAYICADRWLRNNYGETLRAMIGAQYSVRYLVETHNVQAFEQDVSAYPSIIVISREKQGVVTVAKALPGIESASKDYVVSHIQEARSNSVLQAARFETWFSEGSPWTCTTPEALASLKKLEKKYLPLESDSTGTVVGIGVATGADDVFITRQKPDVEKDRFLPLAMVSDVGNAKIDWSGHYLINPWNKDGLVNPEKYPRLFEYFEKFKTKLKGRHTAKKNRKWYRTIDRVSFPLLSQKKLFIADIKHKLIPSLDDGQTYPHHNIYWITSKTWDLRVLGAILMSDVAQFFVSCYGLKMRGGYFRFQAQYLRRIRVPNPDSISQKDNSRLIDAFESRDLKTINEVSFKIYGIKTLPRLN